MATRIIFMGSPEFAIPSLKALANTYQVVGVVTQPDRPAGRGQELKPLPIKILATELNIPVIQPHRLGEKKALDQLINWDAEIIIVAAFGQILKTNVLELPKYGCVNVHASLLPRWRGAAPVNAAILHGDQETGITIMKMDEGLDTGPIYSKRKILIEESCDSRVLSAKLAEIGSELLLDTLPKILLREILPEAQNDSEATYAPLLKKEDGLLDFNQTAMQLERTVRAYSPWPGTYTKWGDNILKVHKAYSVKGRDGAPGQTIIKEKLPGIFTSNGILILDEVQPGGKKRMPGKVFLNGAIRWGEEKISG